MIQNKIRAESNQWAVCYALALQEGWKKEIEAAIEQVKGEAAAKRGGGGRGRRRGYWTPAGFVWFRGRRKVRHYERRARGGYGRYDSATRRSGRGDRMSDVPTGRFPTTEQDDARAV